MTDSGFAAPDDLMVLQRRTDAFLSGRSGQRLPSFKKEGAANQHALRALDNCLQGFGLALERFKPAVVLQPLDPEVERRYFVPAERLSGFLCGDLGLSQRSCIENLQTHETRLEINWREDRRLLLEVVDAGSVGMPARHYLYAGGGCGLRGFVMPDPPHVRWDHFRNAIKAAGLVDIFHEGKVLIGLRKGPWSGAAHYQTLRTVLENLALSSGPEDSLFKLCVEDIARDVHRGQPPTSAFEGPGLQDLWEALLGCDFFAQKGGREKASRWFGWHTQMEPLLPCLGMLKFALLRIGIEQGDR